VDQPDYSPLHAQFTASTMIDKLSSEVYSWNLDETVSGCTGCSTSEASQFPKSQIKILNVIISIMTPKLF
jgi:hypothetical protein